MLKPSQRAFMTNISSYDNGICLVDKEKTMHIVYLDTSKAFDNGSHSILMEKLAAYGLDRYTFCQIKSVWMA